MQVNVNCFLKNICSKWVFLKRWSKIEGVLHTFACSSPFCYAFIYRFTWDLFIPSEGWRNLMIFLRENNSSKIKEIHPMTTTDTDNSSWKSVVCPAQSKPSFDEEEPCVLGEFCWIRWIVFNWMTIQQKQDCYTSFPFSFLIFISLRATQ